jgi:hypothetical protein
MKDEAGAAIAECLEYNHTILAINVDMNDFNFSNYSAIMERLKENKSQYKKETISRHTKQIEILQVKLFCTFLCQRVMVMMFLGG